MVVGCQPFAGESMRWIKDTVTGLANPHDAAARNRVSKVRPFLEDGRSRDQQMWMISRRASSF